VLRDKPARIASPERLLTPAWWAILRTDEGTIERRLESREAELLVVLSELPVRDALARFERSCSDEERHQLPRHAQRWLTNAVTLGFFARRL
jgi:hypothetical protein